MKNTRRQFVVQSAIAASAAALSGQSMSKAKADIFQAAEAGDTARVTELVTASPDLVLARSTQGLTALHHAAIGGHPATLTYLTNQGSDFNAGPENPVLAAIDHADHDAAYEMSWFLLANGSDPNARRHDGKTALHIAANLGFADICEMLVHCGADVTVRDSAGKTPLEVASRDAVNTLRDAGKIERVHFDRRYTLDYRSKPYEREETTGLPWTVVNKFSLVAHFDFDTVKKLHQDHPELRATRSTWDEMAIEAAAHMGRLDMVQWLGEAGSPVSTCTAVLLGFEDQVKRTLKEDPLALYERGAHDIAILAYAAWGHQQTSIADVLLKAGANVRSIGLRMTTLHIAAMKGHLDLAALLIEHGADVNDSLRINGRPTTPLDMAIRNKQEKMQEFLRSKGARG